MLIDLGHVDSFKVAIENKGSEYGTPSYWPPEVWKCDDNLPQRDLWALGVLLFELVFVFGEFLFTAFRSTDILQKMHHMKKNTNLWRCLLRKGRTAHFQN